MARFIRVILFLAILGLAAFYVLTRPGSVDEAEFAGLTPDVVHGKDVFHAAGCASCHVAPKAEIGDAPVLSGGQAFHSDFGTFYAPNISPDPDHGIGGWSTLDLANAVIEGVSPGGKHYYPAFPYVSYARMAPQDLVDLKAFMDTLPPSDTDSRDHDVGFPFNIRRTLGGWKLLFGSSDWVLTDVDTPELERGRYLVEVVGHCAECHTPRNALGGLDHAKWLTGAALPGEGKVPPIAPALLDWSEEEIAYYLETGFTPEFDSAGGAMTHVIENFAKLPAEDRAAVASYLKALP